MNRYINHHILLPAIAIMTCIVAACSSEPDPEPPVAQSSEQMVFEVADGSASRAVATTNENIIDRPFNLFGDVILNNTAQPDTIFRWHPVHWVNNTWNYGKSTQYWYMGREHSFVAIHPFIPDKDKSQVSVLKYENSKLSFKYTLPEKLEDAVDLLFATHRRKYSLDNTGPVSFRFTHLLARINISMALIEEELMYDHVEEDTPENPYNKNEYIAVHSVTFKNIKTTAAFSFTPRALNSGETSTYDHEKSYYIEENHDVIKTITVTLTDAQKVPNSYSSEKAANGLDQELDYVSALKADEIIVMLPQTFADDSDAEIIVNYSINDDKDLERQIIIPLKGTTWVEGTVYTYKFLISNPYFNHIMNEDTPVGITIDIDNSRLYTEDTENIDTDSWVYYDEDDPSHNIHYGYDNKGNSGPTN